MTNEDNISVKLKKKKVKWSRYRPGVAQRVGRGIALLFHDRGTRRGWVVSSTSRPHFTSGKDPVPIVQGAGWAPGQVWTAGKSRPHRDSIPDPPARGQSLYRLSYPAHISLGYWKKTSTWGTRSHWQNSIKTDLECCMRRRWTHLAQEGTSNMILSTGAESWLGSEGWIRGTESGCSHLTVSTLR